MSERTRGNILICIVDKRQVNIYWAAEMAQQLRSLWLLQRKVFFSLQTPTLRHSQLCNYSSSGFDTLFWSPEGLEREMPRWLRARPGLVAGTHMTADNCLKLQGT